MADSSARAAARDSCRTRRLSVFGRVWRLFFWILLVLSTSQIEKVTQLCWCRTLLKVLSSDPSLKFSFHWIQEKWCFLQARWPFCFLSPQESTKSGARQCRGLPCTLSRGTWGSHGNSGIPTSSLEPFQVFLWGEMRAQSGWLGEHAAGAKHERLWKQNWAKTHRHKTYTHTILLRSS